MPGSVSQPVIIVGAGVSGLACAQALTAAGRPVTILERARGPGGRCATRRFGEQPVDFGPLFLHGRDPAFLDAVRAVPATAVEGWPTAVEGQGQPCQPDAFAPGEHRFAFAEGVSAFPRWLATGLAVQLEQNVSRLGVAGSDLSLETASGQQHLAHTVVLALAAEQSRALLQTLTSPPPSVLGASALLGLSRSHACLTLMALYPQAVAAPPWQVWYPRDSKLLQLVSHESSKRAGFNRVVLVLQARPAWSREHRDDATWPDALLAEAGRVLGPWASAPIAQHMHRWTWARTDRDAGLAAPLLLQLPNGSQVGVCGDRFSAGGGVEAAWRSGRALAARILSQSQESP